MIHHEIQIVNTQIYFFICCSNSVIFDVNLLYSFVNKSCIIILRIFLYNEFSSVISHVKCPFFSKSLPLLIVQTFPRINTHLSAKPSHLLFYPKHWNLLLPYNILPWKFMDLLYDKLLHNLQNCSMSWILYYYFSACGVQRLVSWRQYFCKRLIFDRHTNGAIQAAQHLGAYIIEESGMKAHCSLVINCI